MARQLDALRQALGLPVGVDLDDRLPKPEALERVLAASSGVGPDERGERLGPLGAGLVALVAPRTGRPARIVEGQGERRGEKRLQPCVEHNVFRKTQLLPARERLFLQKQNRNKNLRKSGSLALK